MVSRHSEYRFPWARRLVGKGLVGFAARPLRGLLAALLFPLLTSSAGPGSVDAPEERRPFSYTPVRAAPARAWHPVYRDRTAFPDRGYDYAIGVVMQDRSEIRSSRAAVPPHRIALDLGQNCSNPFNSDTAIPYTVGAREHVTLSIYDVDGRLVRTLVSSPEDPGPHTAAWDGTDGEGAPAASGVYMVRLETAGRVITRKISLLK